MTTPELVTLAFHALFGLVAFLSLLNYVRSRDRPRLEITLMLASIGVPVLAAELPGFISRDRWAVILSAVAIVAQPYLALRLAHYFRPILPPVTWLAIAGFVLSAVAVAVYKPPLPKEVTLAIVAYFLLIEVYVAVVFTQGMLASGGSSQWRAGFAALGSAFLAAAIAIAGVLVFVPTLAAKTATLRAVLPMLSGIGYYLAFVPPGWLRQAWQLPELHRYLRKVGQADASMRLATAGRELCIASSRAGSGIASVIALWDEQKRELAIAEVGGGEKRALLLDPVSMTPQPFPPDSYIYQNVWTRGLPITANTDELKHTQSQFPVAMFFDAAGILAVPIGTAARRRGVLVVYGLRKSLFPDDDIGLLQMLSDQYAITLENADLVTEQKKLAAQISERNVQVEAANKELESFAYSVSHDLRAPLRSMDGFSQALMEDYASKLDPAAVEYLKQIRSSSQHMGQLIDDLLKLSRMSRAAMKMQRVDLSALAMKIGVNFANSDPRRRVKFNIPANIIGYGDETLLEVALQNLLDNAWKFTSRTPAAIIEFGTIERDGRTNYFVRDTGAGFDMQYVDKLFGPFQRLHTVHEFEGTGIGLATVYRIITRHGGRVWAEGAVGQGATFYFTLQP